MTTAYQCIETWAKQLPEAGTIGADAADIDAINVEIAKREAALNDLYARRIALRSALQRTVHAHWSADEQRAARHATNGNARA